MVDINSFVSTMAFINIFLSVFRQERIKPSFNPQYRFCFDLSRYCYLYFYP